jgi:hypothetical protein
MPAMCGGLYFVLKNGTAQVDKIDYVAKRGTAITTQRILSYGKQ